MILLFCMLGGQALAGDLSQESVDAINAILKEHARFSEQVSIADAAARSLTKQSEFREDTFVVDEVTFTRDPKTDQPNIRIECKSGKCITTKSRETGKEKLTKKVHVSCSDAAMAEALERFNGL